VSFFFFALRSWHKKTGVKPVLCIWRRERDSIQTSMQLILKEKLILKNSNVPISVPMRKYQGVNVRESCTPVPESAFQMTL